MRFAKTTEYAIRVMVFLSHNREEMYSVNRLHSLLNIPKKYLGKLMTRLAGAGLVNVSQGKQGGYQINTNRSPIFLAEIINIVEGLDNYNRCVLGFDDCSDENPCSLHTFWVKPKEGINNLIQNTSLDDLYNTGNFKY
jgi:Rrf2 family protein